MKTLILSNITEDYSKVSYLNTIRPKVLNVRRQFYDYAANMKSELGNSVIYHFNERLKRAGDTLMLGEYAPFILGDLFSISETGISKISFPWLILYEYCLLLDDLMDKERENWQLEMLSSQVLLDKAYKEYFVDANDRYNIHNYFERYRNESIEGIVSELNWSKNNKIENIDAAIIIQGRKAALVKFCVASMINVEHNRNITKEEEKILDNICAAIQLLDDLTDISEDHTECRINIMLSTIYKWIENKYPYYNKTNINYDQLIAGLIISQSMNTTLEISANQLRSVKILEKRFRDNDGSIEYFMQLAENCLQKSKQVDNILKEESKNILLYEKYLFQKECNDLNEESNVKENVKNLFRDILACTPKTSN